MRSVGTPSKFYVVVRTIDRLDVKYYHPSKKSRDENFRELLKRVYPLNPKGDLFSVKRNH